MQKVKAIPMHSLLPSLYEMLNSGENADGIKVILKEYLKVSDLINGKKHPLGFYSFHLGQIDNDINIRLHVWDNQGALQDTRLLIHNHIFNFKSLVLIGDIVNKTYNISKDNEGFGVLYKVSYSNNKSFLSKIDSGYSISLIDSVQVQSGEYYRVESTEFHESIKASNTLAATLLTTETVTRIEPLVYGQNDLGNFLEFKREEFQEREKQIIIENLLTHL